MIATGYTRALEVYYTSGMPLSRFTVPAAPRADLQVLILGLSRPREELYTRIDARVNLMFQTGLCREVENLVRIGYLPHDPGFRGIGYREFFERYREASSENEPTDSGRFADWVASLDDSTAQTIKEEIKKNSRHYAKRQTTFFRQLPEVQWFDPDGSQTIADSIGRFWEN